jgi:hypothetical protein
MALEPVRLPSGRDEPMANQPLKSEKEKMPLGELHDPVRSGKVAST